MSGLIVSRVLSAEDKDEVSIPYQMQVRAANKTRVETGLPAITLTNQPSFEEIEETLRDSLKPGNARFELYTSDGEFPVAADDAPTIDGVVAFRRLTQELAPDVPFYVMSSRTPGEINTALRAHGVAVIPEDQIFMKPAAKMNLVIAAAEAKFADAARPGADIPNLQFTP